jgi:hypothetical protein
MSYDLMLEGAGVERFPALMREAPNVRQNGADEASWIYANDATGVYFTIAVECDDGDDASAAQPFIGCQINFLRPSFFVDESVSAIVGFAQRLGLTVRDPQLDDIPRAPADVDLAAIRAQWLDVTRGWVRREPGQLPFLDPAAAAAMWRHNVSRDTIMNDPAQNPEGLFVPLVVAFLRKADRTVLTGAIVAKDIATVLPPCDIVMLGERRSIAGIPFGPFKTRLVKSDALLARLGPVLESSGNGAARLTSGNLARAWALAKSVPSEPNDVYEKISADAFVDVS